MQRFLLKNSFLTSQQGQPETGFINGSPLDELGA